MGKEYTVLESVVCPDCHADPFQQPCPTCHNASEILVETTAQVSILVWNPDPAQAPDAEVLMLDDRGDMNLAKRYRIGSRGLYRWYRGAEYSELDDADVLAWSPVPDTTAVVKAIAGNK